MSGKDSQLEDEKFQRWLTKLEDSFKVIDGADSQQLKEELIRNIVDTLQIEKEKYPEWIVSQTNNNTKASRLASSADNMKVFLRHIAFPNVLKSYHQLLEELGIADNSNLTATINNSSYQNDSSMIIDNDGGNSKGSFGKVKIEATMKLPIQIAPVSTHKANDEQQLKSFFDNITAGKGDAIIDLCKLADVNHRIYRANEHDSYQLELWIESENKRLADTELYSVERNQKMKLLKGEDENKVFNSCIVKIKDELNILNEKLISAEDEEEKARKVYEAAVLKKKAALESVTNLEQCVESANYQRELLEKINIMRMDLDNYNKCSATKRLEAYSNVKSYLSSMKENFVQNKLLYDIPQVFDNLLELLSHSYSEFHKNHNGDVIEVSQKNKVAVGMEKVPTFCMVQVAIESMRVWRQLCQNDLMTIISPKITEFEAIAKKLLSTIPLPKPLDSESPDVYHADDATVVLYFDHLQHETPLKHVEGQARVQTSLNKLVQRLVIERRNDAYINHNSKEKVNNKRRSLHMLKCNDIISPPIWCLPLTHSPLYLSHLWRLALEAENTDLYVPLEFETEWESENPYANHSDDDNTEKLLNRKQKSTTLKNSFAIDTQLIDSFGEETSKSFTDLLTPIPGDQIIAKIIKTSEKLSSKLVSQPTKKRNNELASLFPKPPKARKDKSNDSTVAVVTPYGNGQLLPNSSQDGFKQVKLEWGAIGYFNEESVAEDVNTRSNSMDLTDRSGTTKSKGVVGNRFTHTNLKLHKLVSRLLSRITLQKIISDRLDVTSANMSLWFHGRTSPGLTKSIESALTKWIYRYDRKKIDQLLRDTEDDDFSALDYGTEFMTRFDKARKPEITSDTEIGSDVELEKGDDDEVPGDWDTDDEKRVAIKYSNERNQRRLNTITSDSAITPAPSSQTTTKSLVQKPSSGDTSERIVRHKKTPEGNVLRELVQSIMRLSRKSQSAIATAFQKNYCEETNQAGVSSWFHYNGRKSSFANLTQCALSWAEEHKSYLSSIEQKRLEEIALRIRSDEYLSVQSVDEEDEAGNDPMSLEDEENSDDDIQRDGDAVTTPTEKTDTEEVEEKVNEEENISNGQLDLKKVKTIGDLYSAVIFEMNRRQISQSVVVKEANLQEVGLGQPALSKFLKIATVTNNERGATFCQVMLKWLEVSHEMPTAEKVVIPEDKEVNDDDAEQDDDEEEEEDDAGDSVANGEDGASEKSSKARVKKCHEEIETCGLCGKNSSEFNSLKSFHMHIAWCYRRRNNMDPPKDLTRHKTAQSVSSTGNSIPTTGSSSVGTKRKNESSTEPEKKKSKSTSEGKSSSAKAKATAEVVTSGTPVVSSLASLSAKAVDEGASDAAVVTADSFAPGYHYETCEVCKEHGEVVLCDSCPCVYHQKCVEKMFTLPSGKWFCPKCNESGAASGKVMPNEMKSKNLVDEWILIYSSALHRWRKAVVIGQRSGKNSTVLVKWWRSDNRGGKTNWVDISKPKILLAEPEKVTSSRSRPSQAASQSAQRQKVKFEDEQRKAMEKYKSQGKGMLMDGDTEGTAPPGVAVGVGGVTIGTDMINNVEEETKTTQNTSSAITDTYISTNSVKAALCAAGTACRAVDIAMCNKNTNVFACTRPPGHHAGRYGCTAGCLSTGFCLLNNAAIAMVYSRVRWGLERVAVVDIDVHFGNGTAEILKGDPGAFFASVHMIYGDDNDGNNPVVAIESSDQATRSTGLGGFYPSLLGKTEITDNYVSVGVFPSDDIKLRGSKNYKKQIMPVLAGDDSNVNEYDMDDDADSAILDEDINKAIEPGRTHIGEVDNECNVDMEIQSESKEINSGVSSSTERKYPTFVGSTGFIAALTDVIIPQMEKFKPELLIISAGFDGYKSDPLGGQLSLSMDDYIQATKLLTQSMKRINEELPDTGKLTGRVISLLEGGYDTAPTTLGLAKCVDAHVSALQDS